MATESPSTIANFLKAQVLRSNYLVIDEACAYRTRFAHEQKLEFLHSLCVSQGYRTGPDCERIRRYLYTSDYDSDCPAHLLLASAYVPDCVISLPANSPRLKELSTRAAAELSRTRPYGSALCRFSTSEWAGQCHLMYLPDDIHSLLIQRDAALFAA